jgi:hypothetical protein
MSNVNLQLSVVKKITMALGHGGASLIDVDSSVVAIAAIKAAGWTAIATGEEERSALLDIQEGPYGRLVGVTCTGRTRWQVDRDGGVLVDRAVVGCFVGDDWTPGRNNHWYVETDGTAYGEDDCVDGAVYTILLALLGAERFAAIFPVAEAARVARVARIETDEAERRARYGG